ncbi:MAG: DUF308 domain-containing protein [Akkermansia sp.]|nr:DUF308 domain-containing protein [Akkermansia sp.]
MTTESKTCKCRISNSPWWLALLGVLELILGFVALASPWVVGAGFMWALGIALMVLAVVRLVQVFTIAHERMWNFLSFILYGFTGFFLFNDPNVSLTITTLLVGWVFVIIGFSQAIIWYKSRKLPMAAWRLFNVVVSLLLGGMVILGWPDSSVWFIGTLVAVELIFSGWTLMLLAFNCSPTKESKC